MNPHPDTQRMTHQNRSFNHYAMEKPPPETDFRFIRLKSNSNKSQLRYQDRTGLISINDVTFLGTFWTIISRFEMFVALDKTCILENEKYYIIVRSGRKGSPCQFYQMGTRGRGLK